MTFMVTVPVPKRGEVWLIDFDPSVGAEMRKVRPAVVISLDTVGRLPLRLIVPITDWKPQYASYPWFVELPVSSTNGLSKDSGADTFQAKSVSLNRFVARLGELTPTQLV
jgi:mRNA interferase MazF